MEEQEGGGTGQDRSEGKRITGERGGIERWKGREIWGRTKRNKNGGTSNVTPDFVASS